MLKPDEKIDDLCRNNLRMIQNDKLPKFGLEGVLLANYPRVNDGLKVCDFCCGTGIVPLLLTSRAKGLKITGIEIQQDLSNLARRNVELNKLGDQIDIITADIRAIGDLKAQFDLITVNPPFFTGGKVIAPSPRTIARSQVMLTLEEVVEVASKLLHNKGRLAIVYRASGITRLFGCLAAWDLAATRMRFVHHHVGSSASTFILECQKGHRSEVMVEPPVIIYQGDGKLTKEMHGVYFEGKCLEGRLI